MSENQSNNHSTIGNVSNMSTPSTPTSNRLSESQEKTTSDISSINQTSLQSPAQTPKQTINVNALEHYWPFGSVCQFFEIFHSVLGESFRFYPELLIDGLNCSQHSETATRAMPTMMGGHTSHRCRCTESSGCDHLTHLHMSLFKSAGLKTVTGENWRKIFDGELNQREDDWPLLWAIQRTQPYTEESDDEMYNSVNQSVYDHDDGTARHPLINYHYYALPPCYKVALLHIHCCWLLNDDRVREIVTAMGTHTPTPFGEDDNGHRYYLYTHSDWSSGRVHFYRETRGKLVSRICPAEWSFELVASNRDQLEMAATVFAAQTSPAAIEMFRKITHEILPQLDRELKLAERRVRRMTRVENEIDWSSFAFNDYGTRTRRARKEVSYKEVDENDIQPVDAAPRRPRGRAGRAEEDYVEDEVSEEDEEDIPLHFRTAPPPRQTRYETRGAPQTYQEVDSNDEEEVIVNQSISQSTNQSNQPPADEEDEEDDVMHDDDTNHRSTHQSDSDVSTNEYASMQTEVSV